MGSGRGHGLCSVRLVPLQVHTFSWLSTLQRSSLAFVVAKEGGDGVVAYVTNNLILCCIQKGCATRSKPETRQSDGQTARRSKRAKRTKRNEATRRTTTEMPLYGLFDGEVDVKLWIWWWRRWRDDEMVPWCDAAACWWWWLWRWRRHKQQANWNIAHTPPGTAENRWQWGRAVKVG